MSALAVEYFLFNICLYIIGSLGDCVQRVLKFRALAELESVENELEDEDRVELRTVWVVMGCVDGFMKT